MVVFAGVRLGKKKCAGEVHGGDVGGFFIIIIFKLKKQ